MSGQDIHTKMLASSISDMVQEWYSGKSDVAHMTTAMFAKRISRFQERRTPDPAQIRADAIREAADCLRGLGYSIAVRAILALLDTPLSPTPADASQADDPVVKDPRDEQIARLVEAVDALEMWDAARGYPVPYRIRDPLRAAIAAVKGGTE